MGGMDSFCRQNTQIIGTHFIKFLRGDLKTLRAKDFVVMPTPTKREKTNTKSYGTAKSKLEWPSLANRRAIPTFLALFAKIVTLTSHFNGYHHIVPPW